jgi:trans-2,3-dihydro-3-hydroxyanthranilate isomerase
MARELTYSVLDVFAERPMEGNPLAVFHDARGLTGGQMQAIAREMNLSETTFLLPGEPDVERKEGVRVRIFTTQEELPFAGHPTLGTASWLYVHHPSLKGSGTIRLQENAGPITVTFATGQAGEGVYATMSQNDPVFGGEYDPAEVAAVLGMDRDDLLPGHAPQTVSTANPFCIVALRSIEALGRLAIPQRQAMPWLQARATRWFYCVAPHQGWWRARMQFYSGEDPATGSAAGPCIAWLVKRGLAAPDTDVVIEQGVEMMRPSRITVRAGLRDGDVVDVRVSGRTIPVAEGRFFLP